MEGNKYMYFPLEIAQMMDVNKLPFQNIWIETIKKILTDNDDVLSFLWYDTNFLNQSYAGKYQYINDILFQYRSNIYKIMTGNAEIPKDPEKDKALAAELFSSFLIPNKWAQNKQVYKFHAELELSLSDSEDIKLPVRVLDRLPYHTFYIDFADDGIYKSNFHGAFVNIVPKKNGYLLYVERIKDDGRAMFGNVAMVPQEEDGTFLFSKENFSTEIDNDCNKDWKEFSFFLLNALLYLCADNAEIKESSVTKSTYRPGKTIKNKFSEIRLWECGYRYGTVIRNSKNNEKLKSKKSYNVTVDRKFPVAHTRRAHWHHYWTGPLKGERKLVLHWIAPTFVSGRKEEVATMHRIIV